MIAIIDYGMGNKHSVYNAFQYLGVDAVVTRDSGTIRSAARIVLPGVGAFGQCMENLSNFGLVDVLNESVIAQGKPFMGICLGMQVLADCGLEKGSFEGLKWIPGTVRHLSEIAEDLKIPHVGWNEVEFHQHNPLFDGVRKDNSFYFVHSYYFSALNPEHVAATSNYGTDFACAILKDNIFATQFHPEKSQKNGLAVLENFSNWRT